MVVKLFHKLAFFRACVNHYHVMHHVVISFRQFFFMQAEDNVNKGKLRLAVEEFKAALALDPNHLAHNVHLHLGLCKALVKLGRGKDALSSCNEALKIDEELLEALVQVCWCFCYTLFSSAFIEFNISVSFSVKYGCPQVYLLNFVFTEG